MCKWFQKLEIKGVGKYSPCFLVLCSTFFISEIGISAATGSKARAGKSSNQNIKLNQQPKQSKPSASANSAKTNYYVKARVFFEAASYEKAIQYAAADLRRNPNRKASILLMAQSYYRLGKVARSAKIFSRVPFEEVTGDAGLEYTLAMFSTRRYKAASVAWQKVPEDHPYRDIAKFYSGVSYMHLKQYQRASQLLRSAKKLPANLRSERRQLIDNVDALMDRERTGQFTQEQSYAYQAQPRYLPAPPPIQIVPPPSGPPTGPQAKPVEKPPAPPPVPAPASGFIFSGTPTFSYEMLTDSIDRNGFKLIVTDKKTPAVSMPMSFKYAGKARSFGGQPSVTLNLNPGYDHSDATVTTNELLASADTPTVVQSDTKKTETHTYNTTLKSSLEGLYPVSDPVDVIFNYKNDLVYIGANSKKEVSFKGPALKLVVEGDALKFDGSVSHVESANQGNVLLEKPVPVKVNTETAVQGVVTRSGETSVTKLDVKSSTIDSTLKINIKSALIGKLNWDRAFGDFGLGLGVLYASRETYENTTLFDPQTPRQEQEVSSTLKWSLPFGISLTGGLAYNMFSALEYKSSGDTPQIFDNSGTMIAYSLLTSVPLFGNYGGLEASYRYRDRKITVSSDAADEATVNEILKNLWNQNTTTTVKLTLKYPL